MLKKTALFLHDGIPYVAIFVTPLVLPLLLLMLLGRACVSVEVMYIVQFVDKSVFF